MPHSQKAALWKTSSAPCPSLFAEIAVSEDNSSRMPREARLTTKRRNESLRRRIETLLIKAHEIWDIYGVDVAMILKNNSQYYTYRSIDRPTWPPTMAEIVGGIYFIGVYRSESLSLLLTTKTTKPNPSHMTGIARRPPSSSRPTQDFNQPHGLRHPRSIEIQKLQAIHCRPKPYIGHKHSLISQLQGVPWHYPL